MHNWLQYIKTNNAFARRDYWVAASASLYWVMLTSFFVYHCMVQPDRLLLCIVSVVYYSAFAFLAVMQTQLAAGLTPLTAMSAATSAWRSISDHQPVSAYDIVVFIASAQLWVFLVASLVMADRRSRREGGTP